MEKRQQEVINGRVVFIGDSNVGKTSLLQKYINGPYQKDPSPTIGAVFHTKEVKFKNKQIILQIWDTAGQEEYRSIGPIYYRNSNAAIAVFDLTKKESLKSLEGWIKAFRQNSDDPFVVIAGNKSDLDEQISTTIEETSEWAQTLDAECIWTSAISGLGINELFDKVVEHVSETKEIIPQGNNSVDLKSIEIKERKCC
ncbi:small GTP-binding protein [Histomonas meleagridis]|uniref:small GTP-binding protein n=1 Tax=Histomonas meleagridis TaxID=135588 RepID=UPI00355A96F2|nr:small GTP-binding protein [Histomonas meleagridis]KAH0796917.1 small GTP-binding protein [Histomonas meleagridis]